METANELVVSAIIAALMASMLVISVIWTVEYPFLPVPPEVRLVSTVMLVAYLGILALLTTRRRYSPGSEVELRTPSAARGRLPKNRLVQLGVRKEPLQPRVLLL